ncbi:MAG: SusC/RagA family TonB-linked outer membrane protein [Flavobacterium sp. BFFFF1]|uniref:SusC/RagA family TonB-linked outer membrane protein n=1 Tax=Flavobacterium sp. BFFFF1 TaxID=2015557 RepID=UPI000BD49366|nr:SusC/RagA family TonB-linked outer membrane protein [Flavobacterium sp. BFFFF1]OYU82186.1 MAG: SusC/RagA family TonB-linked outer membrane protein [Flavobacterium sp. BFFFF1]
MKTIYKKLLIFLLLLPIAAFAQGTLSGKVTDQASGQPLPGVNVVIQGTQNGTSTDMDGNFSLSNVKRGDKLVFSFVGYKEVVQNYDGQKSVSVVMQEKASDLQEVVVQVGYGSVKKKDATGSVTTVSEKDFNRGANVTTENLLNGRVAGLTVNTSGAPGSGSEIRIRGGSSLFASNDPLIVIDGLPIVNTTNTGSTSFLASLNPSTVESITVLKDASATAIYGSRAANGVIIVTTKKGGKNLSFEYNFQYGSGKLVKTVDVFSGDQYRALIADRLPAKVASLGTANTDWQDAIYRRTDLVDQSATLRGNLFKTIPTRLTIGRTYQEGLRLTNEFTRNTVGLSMNPSFFDNHLKLRVNANYSNETSRFADGVEGTAIGFDPTQPIYDPTSPYGGFFQYRSGDGTLDGSTLSPNVSRNPVAQLLQTFDTGRNNRTFGNIELDYKLHFFPDLRVVVNGGFDESNGERRKLMGRDAGSAPSNANKPFGKNELDLGLQRNKLLDTYFVYNKGINDFNFELTVGHSYQKFQEQYLYQGNILDPNLSDQFPEADIKTDVVLIAYFARTNLSYKDFLLTLSYRRDGTSRFDNNNRWGNFPAAAFAWKLKDALFKSSTAISDLKLRLGYGITGQQNFPEPNAYLQKYNTGSGTSQYYFGPGPIPIGIAARISPDLKWEETTTYNAGIDFGFANNRFTGSVDAFYKDTKDLLVDAAIPDGSNTSNRAYQNIGSFTTKGIELTLNANVIKTDRFNWNVNFNATTFQRKITELAYHSDILTGGDVAGTGSPVLIFSEGYTPYSFYVFKQLYDANNKPIEGAYADLNGDGIKNDDDRYIYKNQDPDLTLGFASTMNVGNLDFSFNLRASIGNHVFNGVNASQAQYALLQNGAALNNLPSSVLDTDFTTTSNVLHSDIFVENASFLRMDNITLGYTFPKWLEGKASLRLSAGVQNAFVLTKYSGLDPEITNNGLDKTIYPRQRSILFGANVKF